VAAEQVLLLHKLKLRLPLQPPPRIKAPAMSDEGAALEM
jgi:hypothetical protein